jgi:hypothetical protein
VGGVVEEGTLALGLGVERDGTERKRRGEEWFGVGFMNMPGIWREMVEEGQRYNVLMGCDRNGVDKDEDDKAGGQRRAEDV